MSADTDTTLTLDVHTPAGATNGTVDLPESIFDQTANLALMHQVVTAQRAAARQGTHSTKTRAEVSGGGRKPFRQKGTGNARQGSIRAPHYSGGGISHGPKPRDYSQRTPKKMKAAALRGALSDRARSDRIHVITELVEGQAPSTKAAQKFLLSLTADRTKVLLVVGREDIAAWKSVQNLDFVHPIAPDQLNTYDVLYSDDVIFTVEALDYVVSGAKAAKEETK